MRTFVLFGLFLLGVPSCGGAGTVADDDGGVLPPDEADARSAVDGGTAMDGATVVDAGTEADAAAGQCGDTRGMHRVYYGTEQPSYVPLTPGQVWAVGTWGGCTGTLITPTWVLTAEHCGLRLGDEFCIGEEPSNANVCMTAIQIRDNPAADMTLAELDADATVRLPGVEPVPIMNEPMGESWIGATAEAAGYGQQEDGGYGEREFTAEPIVDLTSHILTIDGEGVHGVCFGDSGGPVFVIASDGSVRTAGDLSNGDGNCVGWDNYTRTDTNVDWIEQYAGPTLVDGAKCGSVDEIGRCNAGMAMWCGAGDELVTESCSDKCGWDAEVPAFRCIEGEDSCGGYDTVGTCVGDVAHWCEGGDSKQRDCGACGLICDRIPGIGAYCLEDPCGGVDYLGRCNGDVAEWCDGGELQSFDCAADGKTCGYINDEVGYYCQ